MAGTTRTYRLAPELRRCCWYVIFCAPVLTGAFVWVAQQLQNRGPIDIAVGCVGSAILGLAMILPLRWTLRVHEDGITRSLGPWSDHWSWDDLASGRIRKAHPITLIDPARPWWRRSLRLSYLSAGELRELVRVINEHYRLPPAPEVPDRLELRYGFRRFLALDFKGLSLSVAGTPSVYLWDDVQRVAVTRMDPVRRDFALLEIVLSDQLIELKLVSHQGGTSPTWRGATAEEISEFLQRHVPRDRWDSTTAGELPKTPESIQRRLASAQKARRELRIMLMFLAPAIIGCLIWMGAVDGLVKAIACGLCLAMFPGSVLVFILRDRERTVAELQRLAADPDCCDVTTFRCAPKI